ncbi:chromosomal replication initiator protein DnaA [Candidatus Wolfebacteria bacterium]|nr:chromosomal replication initiator protein DnaA [Candidatus Wolfebacteria bacterium]
MTQTQSMDNKELWVLALAEIEGGISKANFTTWFKDAYISKQEDGVVYLSLPNQFVKEWVSSKYHALLLKTLRSFVGDVRSLEYVVSRRKHDQVEDTHTLPPTPGALPLQDLYINKEDNLNPRYVFDSFVVGSFNELAYAAAQQVIKNLGTSYNPLFVYGRTGYGKTHLIQGVGNVVKKNYPNKKVFYITSEKFSQELVNALQSNKVNAFKEKYRKYDVFIMDDVQFLSHKEKMQEELFHLFNTLYDSNRQIVFSSDQHPNYIPNLEERLKSRFNAGMIVDIGAPDKESRVAILKAKSGLLGFSFNDEVLDHLAATIDGNVRELEGALNTLVCQCQLKQRELSLGEVKTLLKNNLRPRRIIPVKDVVRVIADFYNIDEESVYKKTRKKEVVKPRQLIMYILREDFSLPYPAIGQKIGNRDHTTVIHSYEKIKRELGTDTELEQEINQIRALL